MSEKPPILFLHGAFGGPEVWTRFVAPWFAARGHQVAAPRLATPLAARPARLRDYVARAAAAADATGGAAGGGRAFAGRAGGAASRGAAAGGGLVLVASPGPAGLGPSLWQLSSQAPDVLATLSRRRPGAGACRARGGAPGALHRGDAARWVARGRVPAPGPESPLALLDGLTWDLPPGSSCGRAPVLARPRRQRRLRAGHRPLGDRARLWRGDRADAGSGHGLPIDPHWKSLAWRINAWLDERRIGADRRRAGPARPDEGYRLPWNRLGNGIRTAGTVFGVGVDGFDLGLARHRPGRARGRGALSLVVCLALVATRRWHGRFTDDAPAGCRSSTTCRRRGSAGWRWRWPTGWPGRWCRGAAAAWALIGVAGLPALAAGLART